MAEVMIALAVAQTVTGLVGQRLQDKQMDAAAKYEAAAYRQKAGQERAISQMKAREEQDKARRMLASQRAGAAGSGLGFGGSFDYIFADTAEKGQFNSDLELWQGETTARGLEQRAKVGLAENSARRKAMPLNYASTIIKGATQIYGAGSDAGYWDAPKDASWVQTTYDADDNVKAVDRFGGKSYSYKSIGA